MLAALLLGVLATPDGPDAPAVDFYPWRGDVARFEDAVRDLEARDRELYQSGGPAAGSILLLGSSSVRLWMEAADRGGGPTLWAGPVVARGYGGARYSDLAWFADRLLAPHLTPGEDGARVAAVVVFVANDLGGGRDKTPGEAAAFVRHFLSTVRRLDKDVPVLLVGVTPTPLRWPAWPRAAAFNAETAKLAGGMRNVHVLDTAPAYLTPAGLPDPSLFTNDRLHQNGPGYELWAELIDEALEPILAEPRP